MKFIIILLISALAFEDIAERLEHDAKFNKDVERLRELVDRVDTILAFLKGPESAELDQHQIDMMLREVEMVEMEIQQISNIYKEPEEPSVENDL
ncbi:hypothetical protein pb186bvf_007752 [Paramecium bursaria]